MMSNFELTSVDLSKRDQFLLSPYGSIVGRHGPPPPRWISIGTNLHRDRLFRRLRSDPLAWLINGCLDIGHTFADVPEAQTRTMLRPELLC